MTHPGEVATGKRLTRLNQLPEAAAADELRACCAAGSWLSGMVQARPFTSLEDLLETSDELVTAFDDAALAEAMGSHPRIGERRDGVSREAALSRSEQAQALSADAELQQRLRAGNREYEQRFGHVFLIRAAGRSAQEMYDALQRRLGNDAATERGVVLAELAAIVRLRLEGLVAR